MIKINYIGNFGNCMFQYCYARILAEENGLNLQTDFKFNDIIETTNHLNFKETKSDNTILLDDLGYFNHKNINGSTSLKLSLENNYLVSGYFQDAEFFNNYEQRIKTFFKLPDINENKEDTLILVRLGDFIHEGINSEIIHFDYYNKLIDNLPGKKYFLISSYKGSNTISDNAYEKKYLDRIIKEHDIKILAGNSKLDLATHLTFNNIICSNSTFSWWGCFLGNAKNIITPKKFGYFGAQEVKSHGIHINNLWNIKNISRAFDNNFVNILEL